MNPVIALQSSLLSLCGVILFLLCPTVYADSPWLAVNRAVVDGHIVPRYQQLAKATKQLEGRSEIFCSNPDKVGLGSVRDGFQQTMDAWMEIQHIRFGPVETSLRYNRFQLSPDKYHIGERQVSQALAGRDVSQLADDKFIYASIALQGLGALERVLYDAPDDISAFGNAQQPGYQCLLVKAIAQNLAAMSGDILAEWTTTKSAYRDVILGAEQGNAYFASSEEVAGRLLNDLSTSLHVIVDQKLLLAMGRSFDKVNPKRLESWRSRRSLRNIILNLEAAEALYTIGFSPMLVAGKKMPALVQEDQDIRHGFKAALDIARGIDQPLYDVVLSPAQRPVLDRLVEVVSDLGRHFSGPIPAALDLPLGFNGMDGD